MDGVLDLVNFCAQNGHAFQSGTEFSVDDYRIPPKKISEKTSLLETHFQTFMAEHSRKPG